MKQLESSPLWHVEAPEKIFTILESSPEGLESAEAARRLQELGPNELQAGEKISPWKILLEQFKNVLIIILLVATGISAFLGHGIEAIAIAVIVLFAVLLGFIQEFRAERAVEALREMAAPIASVIRDRKEVEVPSREIVPGDVVLLRAGDTIPADARLIDVMSLQTEEASLTGESTPVEKHKLPLTDPELGVGDRKNIVYAGTHATFGRGRGVVVATGMNTEFGKIARMLQTVETGRTPLQHNLDRLGHTLTKAALVVVVLIVALGLFRNQPFIEMLVFGIALAVAVVPEALPAVVTISLALGVQRMVKRNALMRRLPAVETLGSTSVICSDKTGTLTKDEMTVRKIFFAGQLLDVSGAGYEPQGQFTQQGEAVEPNDALRRLLQAAVLSSDARLKRDEHGLWDVHGDPTEGALIVAAAKASLDQAELEKNSPRFWEIPFSSETKRMTTLHRGAEGEVAYAKGAPEIILGSCARVLEQNGESRTVTEEDREEILNSALTMASDALRVLAVASRADATPENAETEMTFLGLIGMIDPPRPEAKPAVDTCRVAGIKAVMITGDHPNTAKAVARELGILREGLVVTGAELDRMSPEDLSQQVDKIEVYARVSPAHKLNIVTSLQKNGHIVAMTGDGVNDAPALKKADIGIAMGITGTDVTKEAAAMTLLDDNFASIVAAVEEGRAIFGNIKKFLMYLISSNVGEILLMAACSFAGLPLPLTAVQILFVNLATDGLPALALSVDPPEPDLMRRVPRDPAGSIFTRPVVRLMSAGGIWSAIVNICIFLWTLRAGRPIQEAMCLTFLSLILIQLIKAYNFRSDRHSVLRRPFANKWLNLSILMQVVLLLLIVYVPILQKPFGTFSLQAGDWLLITAVALTVLPVLELVKWAQRAKASSMS